MSETTTTEDGKKVEQVAKHSFLLPSGEETKDIHLAVGNKYVDIATGETWESFVPDWSKVGAGHPMLMSAVFGRKTKAGHISSQIRQQGDEAELSQVDSIIEVFSKIDVGVWREPSEGVGVAKVDRDSLALALVEAQKALGNDRDLDEVRKRLDTDQKFFRGARKSEDVTVIYNKLIGKDTKPKTSADLF